MTTIDVTPADLARLRTRFAAVSAAVGPLVREVEETSRRVLADQMAGLSDAYRQAQTEAAAEFRRMSERVDAAVKAATAGMTTKLVADLNAIGTAAGE